jgi:hypothetical protein
VRVISVGRSSIVILLVVNFDDVIFLSNGLRCNHHFLYVITLPIVKFATIFICHLIKLLHNL